MSELLIFGGTTEGRLLAEFCAANHISAAVSVATEYGASLLPEGVEVRCGRLDAEQMTALILESGCGTVVDATHPYAVEASRNIRLACGRTNVRYLRLLRKSLPSQGRTAANMAELIDMLNGTEGAILSTLGSKALPELTGVRDFRERLWVRVLPGGDTAAQCRELGFDEAKVIMEKGPFSTAQNAEHLRLSGAAVLVTKESGATGGYSEKAEAARLCGAELITLARPAEEGDSFEEITGMIGRELCR